LRGTKREISDMKGENGGRKFPCKRNGRRKVLLAERKGKKELQIRRIREQIRGSDPREGTPLKSKAWGPHGNQFEKRATRDKKRTHFEQGRYLNPHIKKKETKTLKHASRYRKKKKI